MLQSPSKMAVVVSSKPEVEDLELLKQGAEAKVYVSSFYGRPCIVKERFVKTYRVAELDKKLSQRRIGQVRMRGDDANVLIALKTILLCSGMYPVYLYVGYSHNTLRSLKSYASQFQLLRMLLLSNHPIHPAHALPLFPSFRRFVQWQDAESRA